TPAKLVEVVVVAKLVDGLAVARRGSEDEARLLDLQDQALGRLLGDVVALRLPGHLLVRLEPRELIPNGRDQKEHDAAEEEIDERDQRDLPVHALFAAVTSASIDRCHATSLVGENVWRALDGAGALQSGLRPRRPRRPRG